MSSRPFVVCSTWCFSDGTRFSFFKLIRVLASTVATATPVPVAAPIGVVVRVPVSIFSLYYDGSWFRLWKLPEPEASCGRACREGLEPEGWISFLLLPKSLTCICWFWKIQHRGSQAFTITALPRLPLNKLVTAIGGMDLARLDNCQNILPVDRYCMWPMTIYRICLKRFHWFTGDKIHW
jgi:hypothetical protein